MGSPKKAVILLLHRWEALAFEDELRRIPADQFSMNVRVERARAAVAVQKQQWIHRLKLENFA